MNEVVDDIVASNSLSMSKVKLYSQRFLDELHEGQLQYSDHRGLAQPKDTDVCDGLGCF